MGNAKRNGTLALWGAAFSCMTPRAVRWAEAPGLSPGDGSVSRAQPAAAPLHLAGFECYTTSWEAIKQREGEDVRVFDFLSSYCLETGWASVQWWEMASDSLCITCLPTTSIKLFQFMSYLTFVSPFFVSYPDVWEREWAAMWVFGCWPGSISTPNYSPNV